MADLLRQFLAWFDAPSTSISLVQLQDFGPNTLETLQTLKLIEPTSMATRLTCPECDAGHVETVTELIEDGVRFWFITCPEVGIVRIDATALGRWTVSHERLAERLASEFGGSSTSLLDGRVWRVGAHESSGRRREVLLARGFRWQEHASCVARIRRSVGAIVLVPCEPPPVERWGEKSPRVVELERVLDWPSSGISLDRVLLKTLIDEADEAARLATVMLDPQMLERVVEREVGKRIPTTVSDNVVIEVVAKTRSYDEAVEKLRAQGVKISRTQVGVIVNRNGGLEAIRGPRSLRSFDLPVVPSRDRDGPEDSDNSGK